MYFKQMTVTPEMAAEWLEKSGGNRNIRNLRVKMYAEDMKNGNWTESVDPICFTKDDVLKNGHHRLNGVIKAGVPVVMTIAFDVPEDAVIDRGASRTPGDSLVMRGLIDKKYSNNFAMAVVRQYLSISLKKKTPLDMERVEFIKQFGDKIISAINISTRGSDRPICKKAGVCAGILGALISGVKNEQLARFAYVANTGFADSPTESSAIVLRNYIQSNTFNGDSYINDLAAFTELSIKDFVTGNPRKRKYTDLCHCYIMCCV